MVGRDDVRRRRDVLHSGDGDAKQVKHQPEDDAADQLVKAWRVLGVGVDERVQRGGDERPVLRTGVLLL
jgi:hypothetical protein